MILSWRRRKGGMKTNVQQDLVGAEDSSMKIQIPANFRCPISLDLMRDPVILSTGITYDRESIEKWMESGNQTCPVTNRVLTSFDQIPNHAIRRMIQDWCVQNRSQGVERIPTPRIPVTPREVSEHCSRITAATHRGDCEKLKEFVGKIKVWGRESERSKKTIVGNGVGSVLAAAFERFASSSSMEEKSADLLNGILSVLTWTFPAGFEAQKKLGSEASLRKMVGLLKGKDLSAKKNAILVIKELVLLNQTNTDSLADIEGVAESLINIIKEPLCHATTKASLTAIFYLIFPSKSSEKMSSKFVQLGLVPILLDLLVDAERGLSEKALGILDGICDSKQGRQDAHGNALTIPLLVKKMLRVSELATEFAISILWKLLKNAKMDSNEEEEEDSVMDEALQVGAFQKLLVVLQVGCGERVKEKVKEVLKLLNQYNGRLDCVDSSMDFKFLKRPF